MAIKIDFLADVARFLRGTKDVAGALDEVADELDSLGRDSQQSADQAGDALGDAFKSGSREASQDVDSLADDLDSLGRDGAKSADKAGDALGDAFKSGSKEAAQDVDGLENRVSAAFRAMAQDSKSSGKQIGDSQKQGFQEAGDGAQTFKEEADSNAREVAASFDGSAESIADGFQGLAAEALAGFGPAGLVAGIAVAAGIGVAISKMQAGAEEATAMKEAVVEIAGAVAEAGGRIEDVDFASIISGWGREVQEDNWLTFWVDEATTNFEKYADVAKEAGVASGDAMRGMKGSADDAQGFLDGTTAEWERLADVITEGTTVNARGGVQMTQAAKDAQTQKAALGELRDGAQANLETQKSAIDVYNIEKDAVGATADETERAADAVRDKAAANAEVANTAMDAVSADIAWRQSLGELSADIAANGQSMDMNTAAGQANQESLVALAEKANALVAARVAEGGSTQDVTAQAQQLRQAYVDQAVAAGLPRAAAEALATSYGLIPENVSTMVQAQGTEEAAAAVDAAAQDKDANVNVTTNGTEGNAQAGVNSVQGKTAPVDVTTQGTEGNAQAGVDSVQGKTAPVDVTTQGTDASVQGGIDAIQGKDVKIDVQDFDSVRDTQRRIDGIRGRDIPITVSISNLGTVQAQLNNLTRQRSVDLIVNERKGQAVAP